MKSYHCTSINATQLPGMAAWSDALDDDEPVSLCNPPAEPPKPVTEWKPARSDWARLPAAEPADDELAKRGGYDHSPGLQRERGRRSGKARRKRVEGRNEAIRDARYHGATLQSLVDRYGLSLGTIKRICKVGHQSVPVKAQG